jgi:uncharacterized protein
MYGELLQHFVIPKCTGQAFEVYEGQALKIVEVEGGQCADMDIFNLHNFKERFGASLTVSISHHEYRFEQLFSAAPDCNVMFTILEDPVGVNYCGGRCCWRTYQAHEFYQGFDLERHGNCQDNLAAAIAPYGLTPYDVHDCFVPFMNVVNDSHGRWKIEAPVAQKGDFIVMRAEMDCLVAISACPGELSNGGAPKPLGIEIYGGQG